MDKYNEALEKAKLGLPIDEIFPELKESEDEKIRKAISAAICGTTAESVLEANGVKLIDALAYLEKQKENKPNIELIQRSWYMEGYHDRKFGQEPKWIIKTGKGGPEYEENPKYGQMLKEQKPAVEQLGGTFNSYDMAKTFADGQYYVMEHPEKFGLCKPAEWSEEDERMLEPIISDLRELCNCETDEELISDYEDRIAWLESLRPHPHWKPYKEQISALERAIINMHTPSDIGILAELRDNLKKLQL